MHNLWDFLQLVSQNWVCCVLKLKKNSGEVQNFNYSTCSHKNLKGTQLFVGLRAIFLKTWIQHEAKLSNNGVYFGLRVVAPHSYHAFFISVLKAASRRWAKDNLEYFNLVAVEKVRGFSIWKYSSRQNVISRVLGQTQTLHTPETHAGGDPTADVNLQVNPDAIQHYTPHSRRPSCYFRQFTSSECSPELC